MNEEKLVKLLERHFPSREEFFELQKGMRGGFNDMENRFDKIDESLDELKASSQALDKILEQHPVPRIERIEHHLNLPQYAHTIEEE